MQMVKKAAEVREVLSGIRRSAKRIGFVPTMGALHDGHASLVRLARERTDYAVVSAFVNPKQFGPGEDFERYPRDEARDREILEGLGCDMLFSPSDGDIYPASNCTRISVEGLSDHLCGDSRPGHFQGVALIVAKLFNIVQPDEAFFGQKDAQQAVIIQRMAADLSFPVRIVVGPTVREPDGLAMSSRNIYLDRDERKRATAMYEALSVAKGRVERGDRDLQGLKEEMRCTMERAGFEVDYAEIVDGATLRPLDKLEGKLLMAVAGRMGKARLIDNIALSISGNEVEEILLEFPEWGGHGQ